MSVAVDKGATLTNLTTEFSGGIKSNAFDMLLMSGQFRNLSYTVVMIKLHIT